MLHKTITLVAIKNINFLFHNLYSLGCNIKYVIQFLLV